MAQIDKSELKRVIAAMKNPKLPGLPGASDSKGPPSKNRRTIAKMIEPAVKKTGLDLGKINKLLTEDQKALRAVFKKEQAVAAKHFRTADAAFRSAMAVRLQGLKLLGDPFTSTIVTLDKPFLIWQLPRPELNIFIDSHVESMHNSVRVLANVIGGSDFTRFVFFYLWENESDFVAVMNVGSSLVVNGACSVQAVPGIFSGDTSTLNLAASLTLMRWSGWGTDPVTGASNDQTPDPNFQQSQRQLVASLQARGGHIFDSADFKSQSFSFQPFPLSHNMFIIPGKAVVIFEVALELSYSFDGGGDIQDSVFVDFSNNGNAVVCPNVELEILTPLANVVGA